MIIFTPENVIELPRDERARRAPTCFESDLWFKPKEYDLSEDRFDSDVMDALITLGIGNGKCPTEGKDAAFCVAGGIITAITGKYVVFPKNGYDRTWQEHLVWEVLWDTAEQAKETWNLPFLSSVLRTFLPIQHDPLIDRPYYQSEFVRRWRFLVYPLTFSRDPQRICDEHIARGKKALERLPQATVKAVRKAARYIPAAITIFNDHAHNK